MTQKVRLHAFLRFKECYFILLNSASLRLGARNIRIRESSTSAIFKPHAMTNMLVFIFLYSNTEVTK
jgi:hypothetical protein